MTSPIRKAVQGQRPVAITHEKRTYFVSYLDRVKHGRYTAAQFAAYFIVFMLVNQLTYTWIMYEYEYRIREGMLSPALLRPVHPIHADIAENISSKLISLPVMLKTMPSGIRRFHR